MNRVNYQKELDKLLERLEQEKGEGGEAPALLLHSCCAPCSSYVLEYLCGRFRITVFYYNPNISEDTEYRRRVKEQKRLVEAYNRESRGHLIQVIEGDYEPQSFFQAAAGLEHCPEGGERCFRCFDLRLRETAKLAAAGHYDFFGTTLTISPLKNAEKLNEIGSALAVEYGVSWLPSDFKKKNGYKRSVELSAEYGLYRQDYCGCVFSKAERNKNRIWLSEDECKERTYFDLRLFSKPEELGCLTFEPLKMSDEPDWNPQWEEWNCYSAPLRIYLQDFEMLLKKYFDRIYPTVDAFDGTSEDAFDVCSPNWLGAADWHKIISEVEKDFPAMEADRKQFYILFLKWIKEALQHTEIIVVEGNL